MNAGRRWCGTSSGARLPAPSPGPAWYPPLPRPCSLNLKSKPSASQTPNHGTLLALLVRPGNPSARNPTPLTLDLQPYTPEPWHLFPSPGPAWYQPVPQPYTLDPPIFSYQTLHHGIRPPLLDWPGNLHSLNSAPYTSHSNLSPPTP